MSKFYISTETAKGKVVAYSICDRVGGMESEHERFPVPHPSDKPFVYLKAKAVCEEMNKGKEVK